MRGCWGSARAARARTRPGWRNTLAEFTGERVIPGEVDVDLLNEHLARYTFAARLSRGKRVLDAGCGAGYGSAELARAADGVVAVDQAAEAVEFARAHYRLPNLWFERGILRGAAAPRRQLRPGGGLRGDRAPGELARVSAGSAARAGARRAVHRLHAQPALLHRIARRNPAPTRSTCTSSSFEEFREELDAVFPHVALFLENHVEGVAFQPHDAGHTVEVRVDAGEPAPDESHFFVAVCAHRPQIGNPDLRLCAARGQRAARARTAHRAARTGTRRPRTSGWNKQQAGARRAAGAAPRTRPGSWSEATSGPNR